MAVPSSPERTTSVAHGPVGFEQSQAIQAFMSTSPTWSLPSYIRNHRPQFHAAMRLALTPFEEKVEFESLLHRHFSRKYVTFRQKLSKLPKTLPDNPVARAPHPSLKTDQPDPTGVAPPVLSRWDPRFLLTYYSARPGSWVSLNLV